MRFNKSASINGWFIFIYYERAREFRNKIHFYDGNLCDKLWDFPCAIGAATHRTLCLEMNLSQKKGFMRLRERITENPQTDDWILCLRFTFSLLS